MGIIYGDIQCLCLRLTFEDIPHTKIIWVSQGVLSKGLGVQKDTQMPCWLTPGIYLIDVMPFVTRSILEVLIKYSIARKIFKGKNFNQNQQLSFRYFAKAFLISK